MRGPQRFEQSQFRPAAPYRGAQAHRAGMRAPYNYGRPNGNSADRYRDHDGHRFRRPYISPFALRSTVIVPEVWPGYYGFPDWLDYDDSYDASNGYDPGYGYDPGNGVGYGDQGGDWNPPQQPAPWPSYGPDASQPYGPEPYSAQPFAPPAHQPQATYPVQQSVTLIFRDGRAPEHVHNYLLTPTMLYVGDSARHEIPLSQLDVEATEAANEEAGVDFHLPHPVN